MKIEAESGIKKEATGKEVSRPPAGRKPRTPRSSRGSIPKKMRHAMTPAQRSFWAGTRLHPRLHGRIARLQWVGRDLVDLVCHDSRLVIEIETEPPVADAAKGARDARLRMVGYQVLRLGNSEVLTHVRSVLDLVAHMIDPLPVGSADDAATAPAVDRDTGCWTTAHSSSGAVVA